MITQEEFDRGVAGTIIQGFVHKNTYQNMFEEQSTGRPCRCFLGHMFDTPVGDEIYACLNSWWSRRLARKNDASVNLEDFCHRMSYFALDNGLDDSVCWMEVEQ